MEDGVAKVLSDAARDEQLHVGFVLRAEGSLLLLLLAFAEAHEKSWVPTFLRRVCFILLGAKAPLDLPSDVEEGLVGAGFLNEPGVSVYDLEDLL